MTDERWGTRAVGHRDRNTPGLAADALPADDSINWHDALVKERDDVVTRRKAQGLSWSAEDVRETLSGIALAGGGIRSATFSLGVLQALGEHGGLRLFDFLSTVSGGGYTGGWLSAWLSRTTSNEACEARPDRLFPPPELVSPDRQFPPVQEPAKQPTAKETAAEELASKEPVKKPAKQPTAEEIAAKALASKEPVRLSTGNRSVLLCDPIHHLRLFSNYLTPRMGLLSADTWRAAVVIVRNLILTWLTLLPLLLAAVMLGHLYFVADGNVAESARFIQGAVKTDSLPIIVSHARIVRAVTPGLVVFVWLVGMTTAWMVFNVYSKRRLAFTIVGFAANIVSAYIIWSGLHSPTGTDVADWWHHPLWHVATVLAVAGLIATLVGYGLGMPIYQRFFSSRRVVSSDVLRNTIIRHQAVLLEVAVIVTVALLTIAIGADALKWLLNPTNGQVAQRVQKAGGWAAVLVSLGSAGYAVIKSAPSTKGGDTGATTGTASRLAFAIAPPLLVTLLILGLSALARQLLHVPPDSATATPTTTIVRALLIGGFLEVLFGVSELASEPGASRWTSWSMAVVVAAIAGAIGFVAADLPRFWMYALSFFAIGSVGVRLVMTKVTMKDGSSLRLRGTGAAATPYRIGVAVGVVVVASLGLAFVFTHGLLVPPATTASAALIHSKWLKWPLTAFVVFVPLFLCVELAITKTDALRSIGLVGVAGAGAAICLVIGYLPATHQPAASALVCVCAAAILVSTVVALGWMGDPNLMSLHAFYRARLVRAYLGASNIEGRRRQEITDTAPGDDLPLHTLLNAKRGAPLHLINTTLNLVGGSDLATSQRLAAPFLLSQRVCGSMRTGYQETEQYMSGRMTLGTAVATSGAAVSPNMGSRSQTAAIALLLALFDVRLGLWAPTPNKPRWAERQPRMWPFYLLRESFSQTDDVGTYCYLTDGGHFDNTGLYALVERGVRDILIVDSGEDPEPSFADLGDAIRRCRIDFGAEIDLATGGGIFRSQSDGRGGFHWTVGHIVYAPAHLRSLWGPQKETPHLRGTIVWIKPFVAKQNSVDVQQYQFVNKAFPNQTTVNQWFDEAQFESYRALGYQSASELTNQLCTDGKPLVCRSFFASMEAEFDYQRMRAERSAGQGNGVRPIEQPAKPPHG
jgi:hypothetical protein